MTADLARGHGGALDDHDRRTLLVVVVALDVLIPDVDVYDVALDEKDRSQDKAPGAPKCRPCAL
jgi:hypothetical protein